MVQEGKKEGGPRFGGPPATSASTKALTDCYWASALVQPDEPCVTVVEVTVTALRVDAGRGVVEDHAGGSARGGHDARHLTGHCVTRCRVRRLREGLAVVSLLEILGSRTRDIGRCTDDRRAGVVQTHELGRVVGRVGIAGVNTRVVRVVGR